VVRGEGVESQDLPAYTSDGIRVNEIKFKNVKNQKTFFRFD
jgi:hypothetical protein